ncbi:MAG: sel1 repeat family protein [Bryobacterales bacterium]|nr:sel1 repeat family protein [Bryobacterales bacterium]
MIIVLASLVLQTEGQAQEAPGSFAVGVSLFELRQSAEAGDADAQHKLGNAYFAGIELKRDYAEAAKWYRKAAEQGKAASQYYLGSIHSAGQIPLPDYSEAAKWLFRSAQQGYRPAFHGVGILYEKGRGVQQSDMEAVNWFRRAADFGYVGGQYKMARAYESGRGVPQDLAEAYFWWSLAISGASGDEKKSFIQERKKVADQMTAVQVKEAQGRVRVWKKAGGS